METCQRCQSVLPRTAHVCQVCGTPVGLVAPGDPRSAASWRSNESSRPATIDADTFLSDLLDERPPDPAPEEAFDPSSWQTAPPESEPGLSSRELETQDPFSLTPDQRAALAHKPTPPQPPQEQHEPPPAVAPEHLGAPWQSLAEGTGLANREPVMPNDGPSLEWQEAGWDETSHDAMHPRRTGHDGARPRTESDNYSPVPESTMSNPIEELPTRAVPAISNRVDADISVGPHENHRLVTIGSGVLAMLMFVASTAAMLFTETGNNALTASAAVGQDVANELAYVEDPESVVRLLSPGLVQVTFTGCNGVPTVYGGAMVTQSDTIIVPLPANPESAQVMVSTSAGDVVGAVAGWGLNERMALIQLPSSLAADPLVWGSANNLAKDSELTLITLQAGVWTASPARTGTIVRNRDGAYSNVHLSDGTLIDGALVISDGNLVGMVKPSEATSIVTADILRSAVGRMLVDRSWTPTLCAVDPATSTTTTPAPPGG